jgi:hypothetical protein
MGGRRRIDLRHALATLGLQPGATDEECARQYKNLVKRWHPDHFAGDPQLMAAATRQLQLINRSYEVVRHACAGVAVPAPSVGDRSARRLTREEIEGIIDAIRSLL